MASSTSRSTHKKCELANNFQKICLHCQSLLDINNDWEKRNEALINLEKVLNTEGNHNQAFVFNLLKSLKFNLKEQILDRRSSISKLACSVVALLSQQLQCKFESFAQFFLPELFKVAAISIQVISQAATVAAKSIIVNCHSHKILGFVFDTLINDKSAKLRHLSAQLLLEVVSKWKLSEYMTVIKRIEESIIIACEDADTSSRTTGKELFYCYTALCNDRADFLLKQFRNPIRLNLGEISATQCEQTKKDTLGGLMIDVNGELYHNDKQEFRMPLPDAQYPIESTPSECFGSDKEKSLHQRQTCAHHQYPNQMHVPTMTDFSEVSSFVTPSCQALSNGSTVSCFLDDCEHPSIDFEPMLCRSNEKSGIDIFGKDLKSSWEIMYNSIQNSSFLQKSEASKKFFEACENCQSLRSLEFVVETLQCLSKHGNFQILAIQTILKASVILIKTFFVQELLKEPSHQILEEAIACASHSEIAVRRVAIDVIVEMLLLYQNHANLILKHLNNSNKKLVSKLAQQKMLQGY